MHTDAALFVQLDAADDRETFEQNAIEEFWNEESAKYCRENFDHMQDFEPFRDALRLRIDSAFVFPETAVLAFNTGNEIHAAIRAFAEANAKTIEARCVRRADSYRSEGGR